MTQPALNRDFLDMIQAMNGAEVEYLVVGAHAMAVHGVPRATGDFDIWVKPSRENAERMLRALHEFGAPVAAHGISVDDLEEPDMVYQIGLPPRRIDLITGISGVRFAEAWSSKVNVELEGLPISVIGRLDLIRNKRASGRAKDLIDLEILERNSEIDALVP
jgi:hypothetical protein